MALKRRSRGRYPAKVWNLAIWATGMAVTVLWLIPIIWLFSSSLKPEAQILTLKPQLIPRTITLEHYRSLFDYPILLWLRNSLVVSVATTVLTLATACPAGYAFARFSFKGHKALFMVVLASLMVPFESGMVALYLLVVRMGIRSTLLGMILPVVVSPVSVYVFRNFFFSLPKDLEDAAAIDGCGPWETFLRVALPLAKPALVVLTIVNFVDVWNQFLWPLLVGTRETKTLAVGITILNPSRADTSAAFRFGPAMAAAGVLALPTLIVYLLLQRHFVEGVSTTGLKG